MFKLTVGVAMLRPPQMNGELKRKGGKKICFPVFGSQGKRFLSFCDETHIQAYLICIFFSVVCAF